MQQLGMGLSPEKIDESEALIAIIEHRLLIRGSLTFALSRLVTHPVCAFESVEDWETHTLREKTSLIVYSSPSAGKSAELNAVEQIMQKSANIPLIVISTEQDPDHIIALLHKGARGFVPSTVSLDFAAGAMRFVIDGGVFVPASSLQEARRVNGSTVQSEVFTNRQLAVVTALRMGKANKTIAYELNMCESTVKVHIRNVMRKLKAKNRTHLVYLANEHLK